jgi:uncharacterized protein (DUF1015 family)
MEIHPFPGWRFASGDLTGLIAPPYDILTAEDKQQLLAADPRNIVAVDLPHVPPKELGPEGKYEQAAQTLLAWKSDGTLAQDPPSLYVYEQTYTWAGQAHTRRAMLAGVRATPLGQDVIPHEHTFAGPKADRLKLTEKTRSQLSPIFGFYGDAEGVVSRVLAEEAAREPDATGKLGPVTEKIWRLSDPQRVAAVVEALAGVPAYIADGHHRYTTALNYRDGLLAEGQIGPDHEANFVLFALVERSDPGLLVLPTHRLVGGLSDAFGPEALFERLGDAFEIEKLDLPDSLADADAVLAGRGEHAMGLLTRQGLWCLRLKDPEPMARAAGEHGQAWRELDVAILHTLILDEGLAPWAGDAMEVRYTPHGEEARRAVENGDVEAAFLLRGTKLSQVEAVADAGESMPHKSTYFYPKIATGMVLKPLA